VTRFDVSAVVVAWNAGETLETCVESLRASSREACVALQLVLVDNASDDDAVARLPFADGDRIVCNPVNAGYGVAASQGIALASAPWVLLANPDLVVSPTFFSHLMAAARAARDEIATLVPEMRYASTPETINCRGITVDQLGIPAEIDAGLPVDARGVDGEPLGGSSGCCLLRLEALRHAAGLELAYFAYLEDVDLALRFARAGYRAQLVPEAVAWHHGSAAAGATSPLKTFLVARNRRLLFRLEGPTGWRRRLGRSLVELGHASVSSAIGSPTSPWLGRLDALRLRRYISFVRRARRRHDERSIPPAWTPPASVRATLQRKRAAAHAAHDCLTHVRSGQADARIDKGAPPANTGSGY
jgi:N-acetylglucosaminyl-diphospho-decaprenol L-rhamnosyltransferase